jgi:hypothetical protein
LLAIGDNAIIHKLRQLPIDTLLTLLRLPAATVAQVATVVSTEELVWLAEQLAPLSAEEAIALAQRVGDGTVTVAALQASPNGASVSGASGDDAQVEITPNGEPNVPPQEAAPVAGLPAALATWTPWADNGVVVAAGLLLLLLVAVGLVVAMRREMVDPPV